MWLTELPLLSAFPGCRQVRTSLPMYLSERLWVTPWLALPCCTSEQRHRSQRGHRASGPVKPKRLVLAWSTLKTFQQSYHCFSVELQRISLRITFFASDGDLECLRF